VFISSEGDAEQLIKPFIKEFSLTSGRQDPRGAEVLPDTRKRGIRNNLALRA